MMWVAGLLQGIFHGRGSFFRSFVRSFVRVVGWVPSGWSRLQVQLCFSMLVVEVRQSVLPTCFTLFPSIGR